MKNILKTFTLLAATVAIFSASQTTAQAKAPAKFKVKVETSCGNFVVEVTRQWAPIGADQFHKAVTAGFYNDCRFFRVVPNFVVQFGINGDPKMQAKWRKATIKDDPVTQSNKKGYVVFATAGPNTRTTQLFVNLKDNTALDRQGFAPFGKVTSGMNIVEKIYADYGGRPNQGAIQTQGNKYLKTTFPKLDYIKKATIVK